MFSRNIYPFVLVVLLTTIYTPMLIAQRVEQTTNLKIQTPIKQSNSLAENSIDLISLINSDNRGLALKMISYRLSDTDSLTTSMNFIVQSRGSNSITVRPSVRILYEVEGVLSDDNNQGLALFGFNLVFDGGDLEQAFSPLGEPTPECDNPMINFTIPWGINNPAGYGGTMIDGDLIQVGGGQNTINNTPDNAEFPIGPVLTGVAQPSVCGPVVLVTGELIAPDVEGIYTLSVTELFGNVIKHDTNGDPFWETESVGVGTLTPLMITVCSLDDCPSPKLLPRVNRLNTK